MHILQGRSLPSHSPIKSVTLCALQDKGELWLHSRAFSAVSIAVAAVCISCMLVVLGWGAHLTVKACQSGKLW